MIATEESLQSKAHEDTRQELKQIRASLYTLIEQLKRGEIPPSWGAICVQASNALIRCIEVERKVANEEILDKRLVALEEKQAA